ncbi:HEAT repeat domain-containing protein, partial [Planctomycetota bacterium]
LNTIIRQEHNGDFAASTGKFLYGVKGKKVMLRLATIALNKDHAGRNDVIRRLGKMPTLLSKLTLRRILSDHDDGMRVAAVQGLGKLGDESARTLLETIISDPQNGEQLRAEAEKVLQKISGN